MNTLLLFLEKNQKSTVVKANVAHGLHSTSMRGDHCQCDCHECAGGDTSDDR
jgi:hypothetical protein